MTIYADDDPEAPNSVVSLSLDGVEVLMIEHGDDTVTVYIDSMELPTLTKQQVYAFGALVYDWVMTPLEALEMGG